MMNGSDFLQLVSVARGRYAEVICAEQMARSRLLAVQQEGILLSSCVSRMGEAKELLTKSSLKQCESLASLAIQSIFGLSAHVVYSMDDSRFYMVYADGHRSDLTSSQSGGIVTVVSFVFAVYLILKLGCRRLMLWDEAWMAVSSEHYGRFIDFVRQVCSDFGFDVLLVSHDARLTDGMVDRAYVMVEGETKRQK